MLYKFHQIEDGCETLITLEEFSAKIVSWFAHWVRCGYSTAEDYKLGEYSHF
jgi:hypothetical protein